MNQNKLTVTATFQARPGKELELRAVLVGLVEPTREEVGCLNYDLHELQGTSKTFLFHENWVSKEDLDRHMESPHIKALLPRVEELCLQLPEIVLWNQIA